MLVLDHSYQRGTYQEKRLSNIMRSERIKWKKKCIELAKKIVRSKGKCEWCGKTSKESQLHGSHIYSVRNEATCAMIENILCLCAYCHLHKWHEQPVEAWDWFDKKFPDRRKKLRRLSDSVVKYGVSDWKRIYEELKSQ